MGKEFELEGLYQNVRGLRTKTNIFYQEACQFTYDYIAITETCLQGDIHSAELFNDNYKVYRKDRNQEVTGMSRGGGYFLLYPERINPKELIYVEYWTLMTMIMWG